MRTDSGRRKVITVDYPGDRRKSVGRRPFDYEAFFDLPASIF